MTTAVITHELPVPNASQRAIEAVEVSVSSNGGADFAPLPDVPAADPPEVTISDIASGDWIVRHVVRDTDGQRSGGIDTPFSVPFDPPSDVVNVTVTLS